MSSAVASQSKACVRHLDELCALFEDEERQFIYDINYVQVCDSYAQFKIWAGNIGALQTIQSASSLDYRLREVPKVSGQVISVLEDLEEVLQDVIAIASGKRENRIGSPVPLDHELLDEDYGSASQPTSEIQELFQSISETIASLFKLSILIRNSSSRDRYAKALAAASKAPFDDHFDIDHVGNKFPRLCRSDREWLRERLGKAITQKRQYLYYCREHREKLSRAPGLRDVIEITPEPIIGSTSLTVQKQNSTSHDDAQTVISRPTSTLAPTTASTVIATKLESAMRLGDVEEEAENDNRSQTSYATSIGEDESDNRLSIIRLEEVAGTAESFECPYCWTIQKINNQHSWRKHVMRDLKPYVCTSEDCDMKLFPDRHTWFTHELQNHWVEWKCCFCSHDSYPSRDKFEKHALTSHEDEFTEAQLPALVKVCQKPVEKISPDACPFCDEWESKIRELNEHMSTNEKIVVTPQQFRHHVGRHMEQLALFAIPRGYKEDGDAGSSRAAPGHGSDNSSERSLVRPDYEDEVNPRIHVAAFEGSLDEVFSHFDSSELAPQSILALEGTTWGNVLSAAAAGGHLDIVELIIDQTREILSEDIPVDRKGWGPLHWAASNGHLDVVKLIIQKTLLSISQKTFDGFTAADLALQHGYDEISRILQPDEALSDIGTLDGGALLGGTQKLLRVTVIAADTLSKRDVFAYPDPFVQLSIDTKDVEKTYTTGVIKRTLSPYWNKYFDVNVTEDSLLIFEVFDQKKSKKKDQGHLGRVDIRVGDVIHLSEPAIDEIITRDIKLTENNIRPPHGKLVINLSTNFTWTARTTRADLPENAPTPSSGSDNTKYGSFEDPSGRPLPELWERREDQLGRSYYLDHNSRSTTWRNPLTVEDNKP